MKSLAARLGGGGWAAAAAAIVLLSAALRIWGLAFGMPLASNLYVRPDESLVSASAAGLFRNGGDPQMFAYPALMIELAAAASQAAPEIRWFDCNFRIGLSH